MGQKNIGQPYNDRLGKKKRKGKTKKHPRATRRAKQQSLRAQKEIREELDRQAKSTAEYLKRREAQHQRLDLFQAPQ